MAKRDVPDFDPMTAFDDALAKKKPELAARIGATPLPVVALAVDEEVSPPSTEMMKLGPPSMDLVPAPVSDISEKRKSSRRNAPASTPAPSRRRGVVARASGKELRRLTVYVELGLAQRLRKHCFDQELSLSEVAAQALEFGLEALLRHRG